MANVVPLVKLAISFVVFKPVHNQCIYIHDITRQCVHNDHNCVILLFVKNSTGYSVKIYVLCVFCRLSNFYWIVSQNICDFCCLSKFYWIYYSQSKYM